MINAIECFAHIQIDDLAVSSFLLTASRQYSVRRGNKTSFSGVPLFVSTLFHRQSFVCCQVGC